MEKVKMDISVSDCLHQIFEQQRLGFFLKCHKKYEPGTVFLRFRKN